MGTIQRSIPVMLGAALALLGELAGAQQPAPETEASAAIVMCIADEEQAATVAAMLEGYECLLKALPLERLRGATLTASELTLTFDYGKDKSVTRELGGHDQWVLTKKGKLKSTRGDSRTIRIGRTVRFTCDKGALTGLRKGDLEVKWGLCWLDLAITIERTEAKGVTDEDGRAVLELGEDGKPCKRGECYVQRRANRWAVIEAKGRRVEIPIALDPAPRREDRVAAAG